MGARSGRLREIRPPFVAAAPQGARVRTRLRVSPQDAIVLEALGAYLGRLAGRDLAARCAQGRLGAAELKVSRRERKRDLTGLSSSRLAGTITRTSQDQWQRAEQNLQDKAGTLRARVRKIEARLKLPAGDRAERPRGYASQAERYEKQRRLQALRARLADAEERIAAGRVSVCRGGRALARARHHLEAAGISPEQWRRRWAAARWLISADGESGRRLGNDSIHWHPGERWLEVNLPGPLAHLANAPGGRYRLSCEVTFPHRGGEVAAQAESRGAVRYGIWFDPVKNRWYADASWRVSPGPPPALEDLRLQPVLAVDLNHGHLDAWVVLPDGNPAGPAVTVPLGLDGLPASQRDGRLRAAVSELIRIAKQHRCAAAAVEDLNFERARAEGRERHGSRPSHGRRGRVFRRMAAGLPTGQFRDRLSQMCFNQGIAVIAVDAAYTSRWGAAYWLAPLQDKDQAATGHHAAAVTIGRRAHGHRARRRAGVAGTVQRNGTRRATPRAPQARQANRDNGHRQAPRQPPSRRRKTGQATRDHPPPQATQDHSGPPAEPILTIAQC